MIKPVSFSKSLNKFINAAVLRRNQPHMSGFKESEVLDRVLLFGIIEDGNIKYDV